ncbi:MAG: hydrogenase expression/formation protein HypE [Cyanobacteriota bacterium]|nr:hydrogenase expression/formation protein HypE [Cyanobacteriota bacterium]
MVERIQLAHGGGGTLMQQLIEQELKQLYADPTVVLHDAASFGIPAGRLAFSTDGYVVQPLEFPGGDIGSLAITGTANDLAMAGARPWLLSVALILEEGLELTVLRRVINSMRLAAEHCGVLVATGDTKVVERGKADGLFITTSGIGVVEAPEDPHPTAIRPGDQLLVSGDLGRHGVAILTARHGLDLEPVLRSDCAPLWPLVEQLLAVGVRPRCLRDLTRGGLAAALQELAEAVARPLLIHEGRVPVLEPVRHTCELLGFDPLHLANEGRLLAVVAPGERAAAEAVLEPLGGRWIGEVLHDEQPPSAAAPAQVRLRTTLGTERLLVPLSGELLPRIC